MAFSYFATMFRKILLLALLVFNTGLLSAQDTTSHHLRISLLTCGTGEEIWEQFGHTAVRVTDSVNGTDFVYNYGTFTFTDGFELQFMRGKLLYYVSYYPYPLFLEEYTELNRSVEEQVLLLNDEQKKSIQDFLINNSREENRYYKYDFFFDNCATRIRDIFPSALGPSFKFGNTLPEGKKLSYRDIMNQYFYRKHWERLGVNLLLGMSTDDEMTNEGAMYLPDFLRDGITGATLNGKPISTKPVPVLGGSPHEPAGVDWPALLTIGLCLLTLTGLAVSNLKWLGNIMTFLMLFVSGLLGFIMLIMWFGTDHQGCQNNLNILWALPTNLIIAFTVKKGKDRYAIVAIILLFLALLLHVSGIQVLPLQELWPVLLALLFIYGNIIRKNRLLKQNGA